MNWIEIAKKYPKAYNTLVGETAEEQVWICRDSEPICMIDDDEGLWNDRLLYDFFDAQGIFLSVCVIQGGKEIKASYSVNKKDQLNGLSEIVSSRLEAEGNGYLKCFDILEYKLTPLEEKKEELRRLAEENGYASIRF